MDTRLGSDMDRHCPRVIYIGGYGRSGSTLLDILLGVHPDIESAGEIVHFLTEMEQRGSRCSCGQSTANCLRWGKCFDHVSKILHDAGQSLNTAQRVQRRCESPLSLVGGATGWGGFAAEAPSYGTVQRAVLSSMVQNSRDARYVVDSSKTASIMGGRPFALKSMADCPVYFVHLVRKPESVVGSLLRGDNLLLQRGDESVRHDRVVKGLIGWTMANMAALMTGKLLGEQQSILIRYEDLTREPARTFERLAGFLGLDAEPWQDAVGGKPLMRTWHIFSGNRMRHDRVKLLSPARQEDIPFLYGFLCRLLCGPLKRKLGY
jgi:hypothetical protein